MYFYFLVCVVGNLIKVLLYVTQRKLMRLFEGDIRTDMLNSTYCAMSKKRFDTKITYISYSYQKL